ncbi:MAG: M48 family metallopeptidase [Zoogloeaceae bacterium]|jgi:Zn-dependent protease with chaperone function|nr:M48 family metallopeptidase [Zoogloeaceae bacterium]
MDFFGEQTRARRKTYWLVTCFILAILAIVAIIDLFVTLLYGLEGFGLQATSGSAVELALSESAPNAERRFYEMLWDPLRFLYIFLIVGGIIALASLYRIREIARKGGALIATELGGRPVLRGTSDALERRLLNVIDEMSIAAGIPAPSAFILDNEPGLNAFAAGMTTNDGVIAVTRGLLDQLNRDQLQGVIGHEISHIVNGDSRLNLRIAGVLFGIVFLSQGGRILIRVRGRGAAPAVSLGLLIACVGSIGLLFGRMIQAAVSREREYLADASAVQFTRNPQGLAGALRQLMIAGSQIQHPRASGASHFFFGNSGSRFASAFSFFATHPPLEKRIARIDQSFVPRGIPPAPAPASPGLPGHADPGLTGTTLLHSIGGTPGPAEIAYAQNLLASLPAALQETLRQPENAVAAVYALLLSSRPEIRKTQLATIMAAHTQKTAQATQEHARWLLVQGVRFRLPLLDVALPVLREMPEAASRHFLACVDALIRADGRVSATEFALRQILRRHLSAQKNSRNAIRPERLAQDITVLLGLIVYADGADDATAHAAFRHAARQSPVDLPEAPRKGARMDAIEAALAHLANTAPRFREKLLHACIAAIKHDGKITVAESELLRAFAQSLDCPAPPVLPDTQSV